MRMLVEVRILNPKIVSVRLAAAALLGACGTTTAQTESVGDVDQPTITVVSDCDIISTLDRMAAASDVVVVATVGELRERSTEGGGFLMAYFSLEVDEWLKDAPGLSKQDVIYVSVPDESTGVSPEEQLKSGTRVVVFGDYISAASAPVSIPAEGLLSPLGCGTGLLDVRGDTVVARSSETLGLAIDDKADVAEPLTDENGQEAVADGSRPMFRTDLDSLRALANS